MRFKNLNLNRNVQRSPLDNLLKLSYIREHLSIDRVYIDFGQR